jgi:RNA ligase
MTTNALLDRICTDVVAGRTDWSELGNITARATGPFVVLNYTARAAFEGVWTPAERICRGLIVDRRTGEVAARAFDRFFNWGEGGRTTTAPVETVLEKADGSLAILVRTDDGPVISTRGSMESEQARWATAFLRDRYHLDGLDDDLTLLWEAIYPENRIVVDYGDRQDLVLLAARNRRTGTYAPHADVVALAGRYGFSLPRLYDPADPDALASLCATLPANDEGFVVTFTDGQRFKFKGEEYKRLHRLVTGLSFGRVLEAVAAGTLQELFEAIPDEFLADARAWAASIEAERQRIHRTVKAALRTAPARDRKSIALHVTRHPDFAPVAAYVFTTLDGGDVDGLIYRRAFQGRGNGQ